MILLLLSSLPDNILFNVRFLNVDDDGFIILISLFVKIFGD